LETTEKVYKGDEHMCFMDGFVCFHNSELVSGRLGKATLGGGNKSSLFQVHHRNDSKSPLGGTASALPNAVIPPSPSLLMPLNFLNPFVELSLIKVSH
jgi:hypothetical protein